MNFLRISCFVFVLSFSLLGQNNPVPFINNPLVPANAAPGSAGMTLTVNGTGFASGASVTWNGMPLVTRFLSGSRLQANIPAQLLRNAQTTSVTVVNGAPGGGASNTDFFEVTDAVSPPPFQTQNETALSVWGTLPVDLNGDGIQDLVVNNGPVFQSISTMLGHGDGTFSSPVTYTVGPDPSAIVAADFNADGKIDIAVTSLDKYFLVFLGNGDGTLQGPVFYPADIGANAIAAADFNGDGKLDIVTAGSKLSVLLGNGDGTFTLGSHFGKGATFATAVGDFNQDGKLDVASSDGRDGLLIFLGKGDGTFTRGSSPQIGADATQLVAQDLNGDGKLDLVAATLNSNGGNNVVVVLGNGNGRFKPPTTYQCCSGPPNAMVVADFNGDGLPDIATPFGANGGYEVSVLLGNGDGTLQQPVTYPLATASAISAADFNNDGRLDLAFGQGLNGTLEIFLGLSN